MLSGFFHSSYLPLHGLPLPLFFCFTVLQFPSCEWHHPVRLLAVLFRISSTGHPAVLCSSSA
jgi:hypothetical protein